MADQQFAGAQKIGFLLGGGAKQMKQQAFDEGRLNTAKTEDAIANARLTQLKATAAANEQRAKERFETDYIANNSGKGRPSMEVANEARMLGDLIISGGGSDYYAGQQGIGKGQENDMRRILGDPNATPESQLAAGSSVQGKEMPNLVPIGTQGVEDLLHPENGLIPGTGKKTTAISNFEYGQQLPPEQQDAFSPYVRADQVVNAGGVPTARRATTGAAAPVVDAATVADNAEKVNEGKGVGKERAAQKANFPQAKYTLERTRQNIHATEDIANEIAENESLYQAFGLTQLVSKIPGTDGANLRANLQTLSSKLMLDTITNMRQMSKTGGLVGNVSDREGLKLETMIANLSDPNISVGQALKEIKRLLRYNADLEHIMDSAFNATYDKNGNPLLSMAPRGESNPDGSPVGDGAEDGDSTIEEIILNSGDGEMSDDGNIVRADGSGWTLETDAQGNKAWVSPDRTQFEEVAQ